MVMQIKLVVVVVSSSILIMIDRSANVSNSFKTYALSVEIIAIVIVAVSYTHLTLPTKRIV